MNIKILIMRTSSVLVGVVASGCGGLMVSLPFGGDNINMFDSIFILILGAGFLIAGVFILVIGVAGKAKLVMEIFDGILCGVGRVSKYGKVRESNID